MRALRGNDISMVFQEPMTSLNPVLTIGRQITEILMLHQALPARTARDRAVEMLQLVQIPEAERRIRQYPHELSGGMRQRANIIRTLIYEPEVILMDEPFGPLDAQTRLILQNQLLDLWQEERRTVIFITHDLGEAVALADRVVVMSARPGRIKAIAPVPIPRPRNLFEIHTDERFQTTYRTLWGSLEEEVKKGAASWQAPK
jgi:ABC-type nitrate/sulfonate/bicarbonate transport system ATPase subunit